MKKTKKLILGLLSLTTIFAFAACKKKTTTAKITTTEKITTTNKVTTENKTTTENQLPIKDVVKINNIKASPIVTSDIKMLKNITYETYKDSQNDNINYYVVQNTINTATLTITVDNPKSQQIDMVSVVSSDENAQIKVWVNGEETWQDLSTKSYVGWNGSSVYETKYDIKFSQSLDELTFTINDLKVDGEWQNEEDLGKNELTIYRVFPEINLNIVYNNKVNDTTWEAKFIIESSDYYTITKVYVYDFDTDEENILNVDEEYVMQYSDLIHIGGIMSIKLGNTDISYECIFCNIEIYNPEL